MRVEQPMTHSGWTQLVRRHKLPIFAALVLAGVATTPGSWGIVHGQTVPPPPFAAPPVPEAGVQFSAPPVQITISPGAGQVTPANNLSFTFGVTSPTGGPVLSSYVPVVPQSVPPAPSGFQVGSTAFQLNLVDTITGQLLPAPQEPLIVTYTPTPEELAAAGGDPSRIKLAFWNGEAWVALTCSVDPTTTTFSCSLPHLSVLSTLIVPEAVGPLDSPLPNGRFFKQANGFNGAGDAGFAVVDDAEAAFWSEFQRLGGVERIGYPVTRRFVHGGFLTQAFQKLVLQWRADAGRAVPVNVFDDLNQRGLDAWLDLHRQVPPALDTSPDAGLPFDAVIARHLAFLDPYPELRDFYLADPNWLETYGLPLAVKDYGAFVAARLQRATLQLWRADVPWARAGTVVVGNGGDLAKEAGLWPPAASTPDRL